jgi:hypothetical protein
VTSRRTIVVGDVHGCLRELTALLEKVEPAPGDALWFAGDLVNRGPDSGGVVRLVRQLGARLVKGNHDHHHVRWRRQLLARAADPRLPAPPRPSDGFLAAHASLSDADLAFLAAAPDVAPLSRHWVLVHAGLRPGRPLDDPDRPRTLRYLDRRTGKRVSLEDHEAAPGESLHWSERWEGPWRVVYGHHALPEPAVGPLTWGIDTGAVYGGRLTALVLHQLGPDARPELVHVRAARAYAPHPLFGG